MNMDEIKELAEKAAIELNVDEAASAMIRAMMDNIREQAERAGVPPETGIVGVDSGQLVAVATSAFVNVLAHTYVADCGNTSLESVMLLGHRAVVAGMAQALAQNAINPIKKRND